MWSDDLDLDDFLENIGKKKVFLVSNIGLKENEIEPLGKDVIIEKIDKNINTIKKINEKIKEADIIICRDINERLQKELLAAINEKPILMADYDKNHNFVKWRRIKELTIEKEEFAMEEWRKNK